jgi:hypothetical protein
MKKWLIQWLMRKELREREMYGVSINSVAAPEEAVMKTQPKVRIGQVDAINGKLLEVATYKRSQHGPDWTSEYYIIDPAQPLAEQIATVLVMKGLSV